MLGVEDSSTILLGGAGRIDFLAARDGDWRAEDVEVLVDPKIREIFCPLPGVGVLLQADDGRLLAVNGAGRFTPLLAEPHAIVAACTDRSGRFAAVLDERNTLALWDLDQVPPPFSGRRKSDLVVQPGPAKALSIRDPGLGITQAILPLQYSHEHAVWVWGPSRDVLCVTDRYVPRLAGLTGERRGGAVRVWDPVAGVPLGPSLNWGAGSMQVRLQFGPTGRRLLGMFQEDSRSAAVRLWDYTEAEAGPAIGLEGILHRARFSSDGAVVATVVDPSPATRRWAEENVGCMVGELSSVPDGVVGLPVADGQKTTLRRVCPETR